MTRGDSLLDEQSKALLAELARGGEMIFDNAERLYTEACILRENGALSRALVLYQLSNEECGKLEILGAYAMTIVSGQKIDLRRMASVLRDHEAKNFANAYYSDVTEVERAARERGDWAGAAKAFANLQANLHRVFNSNKNAALYVNFEGGQFSAPKDVITADLVEQMALLNRYFLGITAPYPRLLRRVESNELGFQDAASTFLKRMNELDATMPDDPINAQRIAFREMLKGVKEQWK